MQHNHPSYPTLDQLRLLLENGARLVIEECSIEHSSGDIFRVKTPEEVVLSSFDNALAFLLANLGHVERKG